MSQIDNGPTTLSREMVSEIRKQAISQVAKWAIVAFVVLFGIAASGWLFYLQQRLDEYIVSRSSGVPTATVAAFDLPNGCPKGWTAFEPAAGRVILGATISQQAANGLSARSYRETGGHETHQMTDAELPPFKFSFSVDNAAASGVDRYDAGGKNYWVITKNPTKIDLTSPGNSTAFSTMPPFVALAYCKKD